MNIKYLALASAFLSIFSSASSHALAVVEDDFAADGTVTTDAMYFGSSNSSAAEINANSIGLVSGSSGRQMHAIFPTQTLGFVGDALKATVTFTTPATVTATGADDLRIGIFDHLERISSTELGQNTSYNTDNPNPLYEGLPGYFLELDVEIQTPLEATEPGPREMADLDIRRSSPSFTGRLLGTSGGFTGLGSHPDVGYLFLPNTTYTVVFTFEAIAGNGLSITTDFSGFGDDASNTVVDLQPLSYNFGMLALGASTNAFGTSNSAAPNANPPADNGIEINSFVVEVIDNPNPVDPVTPFVPEPPAPPADPNQIVLDDFASDGTASTDAAYFASSGSSAIETNANSIGLVSGSSSRQIHALFPTQTLNNPDDTLDVSITFTTPPTVGAAGEDLRLGLFDPLDRTGANQLGQNTRYSSDSPNPDYNDLPGYFFEVDVESADITTDFDIRRHNIGLDPTASSGRLLATTSASVEGGPAPFTALPGSSGPNVGYSIVADTSYTINISAVRTATDGLDVTIALVDNTNGLELGTFTATDEAPGSFDFGMFAMGSSGGAFGSTNSNDGSTDNGIDITQFSVNIDAPTVVVEADLGFVIDDDFAADGTVDTDGAYFSSRHCFRVM